MPSLREALEGAYDEIEVKEEEPAAAVAGPAPVETPAAEAPALSEAADAPARDETGKFTKTPATQDRPPASPPKAAAGPATASQGAPAGVAVPAVAPAFKAPQSWKPTERELWGSLPPAVQAEIDRREKEVAKALQTSAEAQKGAEGWGQLVRPYEAQIRAAGVKPEQYVGDLLQTAHSLSYGTAQQKAGLLADIITRFGVPPEELDRALVARLQGQPQAHAQPQQFRDPRLDQFLAQQEQQASALNAERAAEAQSATDAFAETHEFFRDVADEMSDLFDVWAKKGRKEITEDDMERAYNICCQNSEPISAVLERRKEVTATETAKAAIQRSKAAASSPKNQPTAAPAAQPTERRAALEAAYDELDQ